MARGKLKYVLLASWLLFVALAMAYLFSPPKKGVSAANFARIHEGTTLEEGEALLGPAEYSYYNTMSRTYVWDDNELVIHISFSRIGFSQGSSPKAFNGKLSDQNGQVLAT